VKILINGETKEIPTASRLADLWGILNLRRGMIVAEVNRKIVDKSMDDAWVLNEGDQVELIQFVGGG
jgi:thiamine biosynthesis protein ThiS